MSPRLSPIEAARTRHPLAEVVSRTGIFLPHVGGALTVRCPMPEHGHPDRTPSLRLFLDEGAWYCFGCSQRAGDVVQWVEQTEHVSWSRAIEILDSGQPLTNAWAAATMVGNSGIRLHQSTATEYPDPGRTQRYRVQDALDAAWRFYTGGPRHPRAVAYLASRSINVTALERYTGRAEAGSTPSYGIHLVDHLRSLGFSAEELVDAGLVHRHSDGRMSDFYRQRVLIPIRNPAGQLAGLVGRNIGDRRWPKYKNPPRTILYDKSVDIYQPLPAPTAGNGRVIVVEGTLDAMAIAVAAVEIGTTHRFCPVTQSGKELSPRQIDRVLAIRPGPLVVSFDGDEAGQNANRRLAAAIVARGRAVDVIKLPDGSDPASLLGRCGPLALETWDPLRYRFPEFPVPSAPGVSTAVSSTPTFGGVGL